MGGSTHEWIQEHKTRLSIAFEGAGERLRGAAERRKRNYDQHVRDHPLEVGQLVWLRNLSTRGRHKIQDLYDPMSYRVLRAPAEGGAVYTIAPVDNPTKFRHVNRALVKAVVRSDPSGDPAAPLSSPLDHYESEEEYFGDNEVLVLGQGSPVVEQTPTNPVSPVLETVRAPSTVDEDPLATHPDSCNAAVRQTARSTAGHHSNINRLPRAVGGTAGGAVDLPDPLANSVLAFSRPWK